MITDTDIAVMLNLISILSLSIVLFILIIACCCTIYEYFVQRRVPVPIQQELEIPYQELEIPYQAITLTD